MISSVPALAQKSKTLTLAGTIEGVSTDGAFPAEVILKDAHSKSVLYKGQTTFDVTQGLYVADLKDVSVSSGLVEYEINGLDAAEELSMAGFVNLQDTTPGTAQTGHLNISGYVLAGRIGLGTSPTLARVQVNESGTIQGVRSITNSGVAVYGQATAGTGLASGGYFTTSSVGGRAMVGDALSTTGSTVGGLFYNRSQDGVAVWGRHINGSGNSIGVYGQTASATGTAIVAENTSTGDVVRLSGADGTILTDGTLPRHRYAAGTTATMVPIAYGHIASLSILNSTGNFTVASSATGVYEIDVVGYTGTSFDVVLATAVESDGSEFATSNPGINGSDFTVRIYDATTDALVNSNFSFVLYAPLGFNPPNLPARPQSSLKYGELTHWQAKDPQGFAAWMKQVKAAEKAANAYNPAPLPTDQAEPTPQTIRPQK